MKKLFFTLVLTFSMFATHTLAAANAGIDQTVQSMQTVTLDGTATTYEFGGENLQYTWKQLDTITTPRVVILNNKSSIATFIAPEVNETVELRFMLKTVELYDCDYDKGSKGSYDSKGSKGFKYGKRNKGHKGSRNTYKCEKYKSYDDISIFVEPFMDANNTDVNNTDANVTDNNCTSTSCPDNNMTGLYIAGTVVDVNGSAISGAKVQIGMMTVYTDFNGTYMLTNITPSERVLVNVTHADYLANSRVVEVSDYNVSLDITLDMPKATLTFDANTGATLTEESGASVALPANGYVDENGTDYMGLVTVKMSYHAITTQSGRATFPGTFEGMDENGTFPIVSYGFMNVELTDMNGNPLNLDGNATATLTYPKDNTLNSPTVIPLWYYDEALGYWIEEGEATLQSNNTYVGTVKHFTSWNLDAKGPRATFKGCVEDETGTKIANAQVQFRSINWNSKQVPTDVNGSISVFNILANTELTFSAYSAVNGILYYGEKNIYLLEGEDKIDNSCVVLTEQSNLPGTITVTGTLVSSQWVSGTGVVQTPMANTPVNIYDVSTPYPYTVIATGTTDANGVFSITLDTVDSLLYGAGAYYPDNTFILQTNKTEYDLGFIEDIIAM